MKINSYAYKMTSKYIHMSNGELANALDEVAAGNIEDTQENIDRINALIYVIIGRLHYLDKTANKKIDFKKKSAVKSTKKERASAARK